MLTAFCTSSVNPGVRFVTTIEFQDGQEPVLGVLDLDEDCDPERELRNRLREQARSVARRIAALRAARKHLNRPR